MNYKIYKNPRIVLLLIFVVTLYAFVIDLPKTPIKIDADFSKIQYLNSVPYLKNQKINIDTEIGGYYIDLFNGAFVRDLEIKKGLDIEGGVSVVLEADMSNIAEADQQDAIKSLTEVIERRVNLLGISEATVQQSRQGKTYRVIVDLSGISDPSEALKTIGQTAKLDFREQKMTKTVQDGKEVEMPEFVSTGLTGADLRKASVSLISNASQVAGSTPEIALQFNSEGAKKFKEVTERNINKPVAIYLDETLLTAPTVQSVINTGQAVITGQFTVAEAKDLAVKLNAGALPIPVKVVEQRTVGPSLGMDSVNKSIFAGSIGLSLVALFMILYYRKLGFFAVIALVIYGIITLAIYKLIPVVLTLPGLAGFILSIGMAVDANIIIFERIKEELRMKKPLKLALENGFGRSWDSIRDANVATLTTAFILFNPFDWSFLPNAGLVRGFAFTLIIGILISLFTGVFITRNLVRVFYRVKQ